MRIVIIILMLFSVSAEAQFLWKNDTLIYKNGDGDTVFFNRKNIAFKSTLSDNVIMYKKLGSAIISHTVDFPLAYCNTSSNLTDGQLRFTALQPLSEPVTLTGLKVYARVQGAYTGDNNNRVGLYSYAPGTGTLTLVASSDNNATLWTGAANSVQNIPFSATYNAAPGIYFAAILYNNSVQTTAPALATGTALNNGAMAGTAYGFSNSAKLYGTVNTQTNLPSTIAMSSITAATAPTWVALY